ncbi:MAG: OsmC family protein [Thiotrichaceae bacterium]|nr:OsmC family protein [Thiotrichaceae bacterium]
MSEHRASIAWQVDAQGFSPTVYNRSHNIGFEGGVQVRGTAAPDFGGNPEDVDPEKLLVSAVASCHMLTFLAVAAKKRLQLVSYDDNAVGVLEKNSEGKFAITKIFLHPKTVFAGETQPDAAELADLHARAHRGCFVGNSVKAEVIVEV